MEVARSPVAPVAIPSAAQVAPPGARDAADGFSQVSTRDLKPSAATMPAAAAAQTTVAEPAATPPVATEMKPPAPPSANGSTAAGSPADSGKKLSQLVKSSIFAQNSSSLQAGEAKRLPTPKAVNQRARSQFPP